MKRNVFAGFFLLRVISALGLVSAARRFGLLSQRFRGVQGRRAARNGAFPLPVAPGRCVALGLFCLVLPGMSTVALLAQKQDTAAQSGSQLAEESEDYFKRWLDQDVLYIISPEERDVFSKLQTAEEKEHFIEEFWRRRDTDPKTAFNEFKEEHYRRIAYANENFKAGKSGWRTDRGRIYIMWGPPEQRELHPAGTVYTRKLSEGGGQTKTFPYEVWHYRNLPGVGGDIEVEFVDSDLSGNYKLALSPEEKDALLYIPGAGNTFLENMGVMNRGDRLREMYLGRSTDSNRPEFAGRERSFDRLQEYFKLRQGPGIQLESLRETVESHVSYDQLPYQTRIDRYWVFQQSFLVPLTIELANQDLGFRPVNGVETAYVELYGSVESLSGQRVHEFEKSLVVTASHPEERTLGRSLYQQTLPLDAGRYKLSLVVSDKNSNKVGTTVQRIIVPAHDAEELGTSTLVLADRILFDSYEDAPLNEPFRTVSGLKIYPSMNSSASARKFGVYFEIYNFGIDQSSGQPDLQVTAALKDPGGASGWEEDISRLGALKMLGDRVAVCKYLYPQDVTPGKHQLVLQVKDRILDRSTEISTEIKLDPPELVN